MSETAAMRDIIGETLIGLAKANSDIVVLTGDVSESTRTNQFADAYPDRFYNIGVAEQNIIGIAAGMALSGKVPFVAAYAAFIAGRTFDQIRISVAYNRANVKIIATHAGLSVGPDGATHQMLEDIAMMRSLPNMTVLVPADIHEAKKAIKAAAAINGPVYIRLSREKLPVVTTPQAPFAISEISKLSNGRDIAIVACGTMVAEAVSAVVILKAKGISAKIINNATLKPLDAKGLLRELKNTKAVITVEEAQVNGGLGGAVAELITQHQPKPMRIIGVADRFGQSGTTQELFNAYKLTARHIAQAAETLLKGV